MFSRRDTWFFVLLFALNAQAVILPIALITAVLFAPLVGLLIWGIMTGTVVITAWWFIGWIL